MPYDVDGYIPDDMTYDHNYCRHGRYVGGCGYDHLCPWCESGEEPPTRRQLDEQVLAKAERQYDEFVQLMDTLVDQGSFTKPRAICRLVVVALDVYAGSWPIDGRAFTAWERQCSAS